MIANHRDINGPCGDLDFVKKILNSAGLKVGETSFEDILLEGGFANKTALFCSGKGSMKNFGLFDNYLNNLRKHNITTIELSGIDRNICSQTIQSAIKRSRESKIDFIVSLGGGSTIDVGKIVSVGFYSGMDSIFSSTDYIVKSLPHIACTTTSGTGSHLTSYAIVNKIDTQEKRTLKHQLLRPSYSVIETKALSQLPRQVIAETGFDALCHALEVYTRKDSAIKAQEYALLALQLIGKHLVPAFRHSNEYDLLGMAYADSLAGLALRESSTHLAHAVAHPISYRFPSISHGQALALVSPAAIRHQVLHGDPDVKQRYQDAAIFLANHKNIETALCDICWELELYKIGMSFTAIDAKTIYEDTLRYRWPSVMRCPVPISTSDLKKIIFETLL